MYRTLSDKKTTFSTSGSMKISKRLSDQREYISGPGLGRSHLNGDRYDQKSHPLPSPKKTTTYTFQRPRKPKLQYPMTYISCPKCKNNNLEKCICFNPQPDILQGHINYICPKCSWSHFNHRHSNKKSDTDLNIIGPNNLSTQSLLQKTTR